LKIQSWFAPVTAIANLLPIFCPFLTPLKRAVAGRASFWGETVLGLGDTTHICAE